MFNFNIVPLEVENLERICDDIVQLVRSGVINLPIFNMTLVPEGDPPVDKARELTDRFLLFQERLAKDGISGGVLLQSTIGHGYILNRQNPYQNYIGMMDELERQVCCPLDEGVQEHFYNVCKTIASAHPGFMLIDDDFRLLGRSGRGCACPLHLAEFKRLTGLDLNIAQLRELLNGTSEEDRRLAQIFDKMQCDSLVNMAKRMRQGVDEIDPSIPGGYCPCAADIRHAMPIAQAFAGQGNPTLIRINCGFYNQRGPQLFSGVMQRAAIQLAAIRENTGIVLTESDTCPQNRYSTSAASLHAHYSGSLLEVCDGAKHWISRLRGNEWKSAKAYRKILTEHQEFYRKLAGFGRSVNWFGARFALPEKPYFDYNPVESIYGETWHAQMLERLGIPMYFSKKEGGVVFMNGLQPKGFTEQELEKLLSGVLVLDSAAAKIFCEKGYEDHLGVRVKEWHLAKATGELLPEGMTSPQENLCELELLGATIDSKLFHAPYNQSMERDFIAPGCTIYRNKLGGTVIVFAGTPPSSGQLSAFGFLCENRKRQIIRLMRSTADLPLYYTGDVDMYMRGGFLPDNSMIGVLFNLGTDQLESVELFVDRKFSKVEYLTPEGSWNELSYRSVAEKEIEVDLRVETFMVQVLRFS
jgi:hypothetical protein